jgi:hypothetical protein
MISFAAAEPVVRAVLYEGYVLYPYRASAAKNQYRWTFGGVYPRAWSEANPPDPWWVRTEALLEGSAETELAVGLRFLEVAAPRERDGWQEAVERRVDDAPRALGAWRGTESRAFEFGPLRGEVETAVTRVDAGLFRVRVTVRNVTPAHEVIDRVLVTRSSFASAHVLLGAQGGAFVSLVDPPVERRAAVDACANVGLWPVLAGPPGCRDTLLASPIILGDYPAIAPESPGDLFDATEIDEILTLRILTLTDAEKEEMRATDRRAAKLLDRVSSMEQGALLALHGALRGRDASPRLAPRRPAAPHAGAHVILRPRGRADVFDLALAGRAATVASVEEDAEGQVYVTVTVDDDPGRDLGLTGQPGHRFFFRVDEVEVLP